MATTPGVLSILNSSNGNLVDVIKTTDVVPGQITFVPVNKLVKKQTPNPSVVDPIVVMNVAGSPMILDASWLVLTKDSGFKQVDTLTDDDLLTMCLGSVSASIDVSLGSGFEVPGLQALLISKRLYHLQFGMALTYMPFGLDFSAVFLESSLFDSEAGPTDSEELAETLIEVVWTPPTP